MAKKPSDKKAALAFITKKNGRNDKKFARVKNIAIWYEK